jgi:hypothetical protein
MKRFFNFLSEAQVSQASQQAKQMGLKGDGHGGWYNAQGEFVAKTESGKLKFYTKGQKIGQRDTPNPSKKTQEVQVSNKKKEAEQELKVQSSDGGNRVTIVFGKFNPPAASHLKLFNFAKSAASGSDLKIYPSRAQDPKKNPMDPDTKIEYMKKMFPNFEENIINDENAKTIFDVLQAAEEDGYSEVVIVAGADRVAEFRSLAMKQNGNLYNFEDISVIPGGEQDADSDTSSGNNSAKLRKSVLEDDYTGFKSGLPKNFSDKDAKKLFSLIKKNMKLNVKENISLWEIAPKLDYKTLRENYVKNKIFKVGNIIENLNTGLVGKIIRRGTNYLICVTEENIMFKSWIHDIMEKNEQEIPSKNLKILSKKAVKRVDNNIDGFVDKDDPKTGPYGAFIPQAKNYGINFKKLRSESKYFTNESGVTADKREVGTDSHREYVMKLTHLNKIKNFINKYKEKK